MKPFGICVKGLYFPDQDIALRLAEWIEINTLLGASKIIFYVIDVSAKSMKVLRMYEKQGKVTSNRHLRLSNCKWRLIRPL